MASRHEQPRGAVLRPGQLDQALRRIEDLPFPPALAGGLLTVLLEPDACKAPNPRLTTLIQSHPVTAALAIRTWRQEENSTFPLADTIGPENLALLEPELLSPRIQWPEDGGAFDLHKYWMHSLAVALGARELARLDPAGTDPAQAWYAGLLHDLGKLALADLFPKAYRRVLGACHRGQGDLNEYERCLLGVDHVSFGRRLAQQWDLGPGANEAIWMHHQPFEAIPASVRSARLVGICGLADTMARQAGIGFSGNPALPRTCRQLASGLQLPSDQVEDISDRLEDHLHQHLEKLDLPRLTDRVALGRLQADANRLLGQLLRNARQEALGARQGREALQAACNAFARSRPEQYLVDVLELALEAVASIHPARDPQAPCLCYGIDTTGPEAIFVRKPANGPCTCLACNPAVLSGPGRLQQGPGRAALSQLLREPSALADWPNLAGSFHLPLLWNARLVGGLLLPAAGSDDTRGALCLLAQLLGPMVGLTEARQGTLRLSEELAGVSVTLTATQDALAEQKTMRAVGQMAAGAAHELNTPLALISGRAQLMQDKSDRIEDREAWGGVAQQAQRISDIISELMSFASPPEPKPQACSLVELVDRATESFLASNHPQVPQISFEKSIGEDLPSAWVDPAQMTGVILELITNAANASPEGGKIAFSGQADEIARRVVLRVMDQGLGMDENTLQSSCTPFFSKHAAGRRRGLGLPLAKRYVENNGGSLGITSKPNQGTEANVSLPIAEVQAP